MKVKRIVSNTATSDLGKAKAFYGRILGLELLMDHGWFQTYGSDSRMTVQIGFGSEGGSGTRVPDLSIEVDDIEAALARFRKARTWLSSTGLQANLGVYEDSTFATLLESWSTSFSTTEKMRRQC